MQYPQGYGPSPGPAYAPMSPFQPPSQDREHLKALSICCYIYAGLVALMSVFGLCYLAFGLFFAATAAGTSPSGTAGAPHAQDIELVGGIFAIIGGIITVVFLAKAILLILAGMDLARQRRRTLTFITAALCCMNFPIGTVLGVFLFVVLSRPSVKALYDQNL